MAQQQYQAWQQIMGASKNLPCEATPSRTPTDLLIQGHLLFAMDVPAEVSDTNREIGWRGHYSSNTGPSVCTTAQPNMKFMAAGPNVEDANCEHVRFGPALG